jgi:hypothetical protein
VLGVAQFFEFLPSSVGVSQAVLSRQNQGDGGPSWVVGPKPQPPSSHNAMLGNGTPFCLGARARTAWRRGEGLIADDGAKVVGVRRWCLGSAGAG